MAGKLAWNTGITPSMRLSSAATCRTSSMAPSGRCTPPNRCAWGDLMTSSVWPSAVSASTRIEFVTVSPMPRDVAMIVVLSISPIVMRMLCASRLGTLRMPSFTSTGRDRA